MGDCAWTSRSIRQSVTVVSTPSTAAMARPSWGNIPYLRLSEETWERAGIVFDPKTPNIDERVFNSNANWRDFYGDVCEELPPNMPEPRGEGVSISCFVDANHAWNVITRRSHTGIIIYGVQNAPIIWFSKQKKLANPPVLEVNAGCVAIQALIVWLANWWTGQCILWL